MDKLNACGRTPSRRKLLLLGTALASSLIALPALTAPPAAAAVTCPQDNSPNPIVIINPGDDIDCDNNEPRTNVAGDAIRLQTNGANQYIDLVNGPLGVLMASGDGIYARTNGAGSPIDVNNSGAIQAGSIGIFTLANAANSPIVIDNFAAISVDSAGGGVGIFGQANGAGSTVDIENSGDLGVEVALNGYGILGFANLAPLVIANSGDVSVDGGNRGVGVAGLSNASLSISNSGNLAVDAGIRALGLSASSLGASSILNSGDVSISSNNFGIGVLVQSSGGAKIENDGDISVDAAGTGTAIYANTFGTFGAISIVNGGDLMVISGANAGGIDSNSFSANSGISIVNSGDIFLQAAALAGGIEALAGSDNSPVNISNSGDIVVNSATGFGFGIFAQTAGSNSAIDILNTGGIEVGYTGIQVMALGPASDVGVVNSGIVDAVRYGISAFTGAAGSDVVVDNGGSVMTGPTGTAILAQAIGGGTVGVVNSGSVFGGFAGIAAISFSGTTITNFAGGSIAAGSGPAIDIDEAASSIFNAGLITGFIDLTDNADSFVNQPGGVFQAQGVSRFGGGNDVFTNQVGAVVDTANNPLANEMVSFEGLETFQNFGTISLLDGAPGDLFTISNTVGGTDLNYIAGSFLSVDAFLGGPGSSSDIFRIDGNAQGVTHVVVNNTNPLPGTFNPDGITVVQVRGSVDPSAFRLANGPIDTGFFNFDLFFEGRDGAGDPFDEFELRSFPGAGAQLLPQLITAAQDIWHQTSDTWFDRSADLRTQLWRNGGSVAGVPGAMYLGGGSVKDGAVVEQGGLSPAVWARVSHGELEQDGSARTNAFGRSFNFNLDRELYIIDVQSGVDFALQGVMNPSDVLLLSVFGGGVSANLQYDQLDRRRFDYDGGQVGVAATYLSGGLFVDALFNAQFLEVDPNALGFAESLDSNAYGFRIDTGYRFGMGSGGLFLEPLLTLAYVNSDLDGFSFAGNTVSFQDEDSLRGRVGLRAGTSLFIENVRFEPFVIASYWGELSDDDNRATLVSNGARFGFRDAREDSWGEVSLGTNTFLAGNNALSAFSKIDIIFGEDTEGYIAQSGFRVQW